MDKFWKILIGLCLGIVVGDTAWADRWSPAKVVEVSSADGKHRLRVEPAGLKIRECRAVMYQGKEVIWKGRLVNRYSPHQVFVGKSGKFVVTMDEWGSVGTLPVVIYGKGGKLVKKYDIASLGLNGDGKHITRSVSSYWWSSRSLQFFDESGVVFFIRLHWGKWISLDLATGEMMAVYGNDGVEKVKKKFERRWEKLKGFRGTKFEEWVMGRLGSKYIQYRMEAARLCGKEKIKRAIPALKRLLKDKALLLAGKKRGEVDVYRYAVRAAAKEGLEAMGVKVGDVVLEKVGKGRVD